MSTKKSAFESHKDNLYTMYKVIFLHRITKINKKKTRQVTSHVCEDVKLEESFDGGTANLYSHHEKQFGDSSRR